jgi:hypothetical protein
VGIDFCKTANTNLVHTYDHDCLYEKVHQAHFFQMVVDDCKGNCILRMVCWLLTMLAIDYAGYWLLSIAYCLLPIAFCLLPFAYWLLAIAFCLLTFFAVHYHDLSTNGYGFNASKTQVKSSSSPSSKCEPLFAWSAFLIHHCAHCRAAQ